jgi:hypothetical protein
MAIPHGCLLAIVVVRRAICRRRLVLWIGAASLLPVLVTVQNASRGDAVFIASQGGLNF